MESFVIYKINRVLDKRNRKRIIMMNALDTVEADMGRDYKIIIHTGLIAMSSRE